MRPGEKKTKAIKLNRTSLYELYVNQGQQVARIAEHFRMAPVMIERYIDKYGIRYSKDVEKSRQEIFELYLGKGWSYRMIAAKFNCPSQQIANLLEKYGKQRKNNQQIDETHTTGNS